MQFPKKVNIRELGPREGFQTHSKVVATQDKLHLINSLSKTGLKHIEIASFVRPDKVPQMADAEQIVTEYERIPGVSYYGIYLNDKGFERSESSLRLDNQCWLYTAASETFLKKNNGTDQAGVLKSIPNWLNVFAKAKKPLHGLMISTAFGCNYEGRIESKKVIDILASIIDLVAENGQYFKEISLADTMGWGNPEGIKRMLGLVRDRWPNLELSLHLHDTRGTGMANLYAGLEEGVIWYDSSVGGMGGCPFAKGAAGNVCTEDFVFMCAELGIETGVDLEAISQAAELAESLLGMPLPGKYYKTSRALRSCGS